MGNYTVYGFNKTVYLLVQTTSVKTFSPVRRDIFVFHNWVCRSIYYPLSYLLESLRFWYSNKIIQKIIVKLLIYLLYLSITPSVSPKCYILGHGLKYIVKPLPFKKYPVGIQIASAVRRVMQQKTYFFVGNFLSFLNPSFSSNVCLFF